MSKLLKRYKEFKIFIEENGMSFYLFKMYCISIMLGAAMLVVGLNLD